MFTFPSEWPDCRVALEERQAPVFPTLRPCAPNNDKMKLKQVWCLGHNACVGGDDHSLFDITITLMVQQVTADNNLQVDLDQ